MAVGPAVPALASSTPSIPNVTSSAGMFTLLNQAFTLTFSEPGSSAAAVSYQYQFADGPIQQVAAPSGSATVPITVTTRVTHVQVQAVGADGSLSAPFVEDILARAENPRADKDINGDGLPDLVTVGGTAGLPSGLWQALSAGWGGRLRTPAASIGGDGLFSYTPSPPAAFDGAEVVLGSFMGDNLQDVLIYYPAGPHAGGGAIIGGSGDGAPLRSLVQGNVAPLPQGALNTYGADLNPSPDNPLQVVNGYGSDLTGLDDLFVIAGDPTNGYTLNYLQAAGVPGAFLMPLTTVQTPDGTPWNQWTLATAKLTSGTAMYLWNASSGALYLWEKVVATPNPDGVTASVSFLQYKISPCWNKGASVSMLEAADFTGDGVPDLWAVSPEGTVHPYVVSGLSTRHPAEIVALRPQRLR